MNSSYSISPGARIRNALAATLSFGLLFAASPATGQDFTLGGTDLQTRVNGALAMMQYCLTPEVTTSSLSINAGEAGVNGLSLYQVGGGYTWSKSFPLYLEGNAAFSRYDPVFIFSRGTVQAEVPVVWKSAVGTVGIGWDFPIGQELVLRPIANLSLGRVVSEISVSGGVADGETGQEAEFLRQGQFNAVGYGGSLMLDYEQHRETYEIDVETRLSNIWLQSTRGHVGGGEGVCVGPERESVDPVACAHRASGAGPTGPVRPGVRLLILFRARRGHGGVQSSQLPRGRARTRRRGLGHLGHPCPPDGQVSVRGECDRMDHRIGDQLLTGPGKRISEISEIYCTPMDKTIL